MGKAKPTKKRAVQVKQADSLDTLAEQINAEHELCGNALHEGLRHALNAGRLL